MKWLYHIPHTWEQTTTNWEDVWLLPDDPNYSGESIWLTVNALGGFLSLEYQPFDEDEANMHRQFHERFLHKEYWIDSQECEMYLRACEFDLASLLQWVRVWLEEKGLEVDELLEAPFERFIGTNPQASTIAGLRARFPDEGDDAA